jgi:hypothetical protein
MKKIEFDILTNLRIFEPPDRKLSPFVYGPR